ncbi:MAG: FMN-binding protein [Eubacteriales bacterium]|jgi:uncharacterized protein with FMN-binding domain|nr:FMN-binding protein [Eubacteriales bacterium]
MWTTRSSSTAQKSTIIARVISAQDLEVDVVAGATHSSDGILGAVANALGFSYTAIASGGNRH